MISTEFGCMSVDQAFLRFVSNAISNGGHLVCANRFMRMSMTIRTRLMDV